MASKPAGSNHFPWLTTLLVVSTIAASLAVATIVNGTPFSTVRIVDLGKWGGITIADLRQLEVWRLATSQLVHSKMPHMLYNALSLALLAGTLERKLGALRIGCIWLLGGGIATLFSPILIEPPFDIGTGASQAVLAFAGCALVFALSVKADRVLLYLLTALAIIPALALDLLFAGYPKPGHVLALVIGFGFGWLFRRRWAQAGSPG